MIRGSGDGQAEHDGGEVAPTVCSAAGIVVVEIVLTHNALLVALPIHLLAIPLGMR
jgi:hypothetical protein